MFLLFALSAVAFLYAAVGHAGASGYIAVLTLAGFPLIQIKSLALLLNIIVSAQGSLQFWKAGYLRSSLCLPLLLTGIPAAFIGGWLDLPTLWFQRLLAIVLFASAIRFILNPKDSLKLSEPSLLLLLLSGAIFGLLAGLTGTGGGVFLSPLLLLSAWASTRQAAAITSFFIFANSISGLAGLLYARGIFFMEFPVNFNWLISVVFISGVIGSRLGSNHLPVAWIRRCLACVLVIASFKLLGFS